MTTLHCWVPLLQATVLIPYRQELQNPITKSCWDSPVLKAGMKRMSTAIITKRTERSCPTGMMSRGPGFDMKETAVCFTPPGDMMSEPGKMPAFITSWNGASDGQPGRMCKKNWHREPSTIHLSMLCSTCHSPRRTRNGYDMKKRWV